MALVVRFGPGDAARCRFAVSPLQETMSALLTLVRPRRHAFYEPWLRSVRPAAAALDLNLLAMSASARGRGADFLWPSPAGPTTTIDDDLARVAASPPERVRIDLAEQAARADARTAPPAALEVLTGDPVVARDLLVVQQRAAWDVLVAPAWDRIRGALDADISARSRQLADGGLEQLFAHLHPRAVWRDDALHLTGVTREEVVELGGRGLVLVPSAFGWPDIGIGPTAPDASTPPALVYPMLGAARLWETSPQPAAVARLLGAGRALVLAEAVVPSTTSGLSARLGLAPATVSQHLGVLRDAGLVTARRTGREVYYGQTELAAALLEANRLMGEPG